MTSGSRMFPDDFLFGAATASHQVEGDNRWNDWWEYEQAGLLPFKSGRTCDHYHRYAEDFDLAQSWGHNCHRFSVEWSRLEPREGEWDEDAVAHYGDVLKALQQRGMAPIVTLNHFTLPAWLLKRGGWMAKDAPAKFANFVSRFVREVDGSVAYWLTINEPTVYVQQAYINGAWPPLENSAWRSALRILRQLARAHSLSYAAIKRVHPEARVGFAHGALDVQPCNPDRIVDRLSAAIRDYLLNRLFFRMIGATPNNSESRQHNLDFIGLNYYTRVCVTAGSLESSLLVGRACKLNHHAESGIQSSLGWEVYPKGLAKVLRQFSAYGLPMLVTENGIASDDDQERCRFIKEHLQVISDALANGKAVLGYVHWSLMDNFEWNAGYAPRFGLAEVDPETLERRARPSAELFSRICRTGSV